MCMLETLKEDARRQEIEEIINTMLDDLSARDLKDLLRECVSLERLYEEARERGYADT